jgi:hypothetical protein
MLRAFWMALLCGTHYYIKFTLRPNLLRPGYQGWLGVKVYFDLITTVGMLTESITYISYK